MIVDQVPQRTEPWQVCIVGTGPVGMTMALELDRMGLDVLVLESGGRSTDSAHAEDARAVITDARTHAPMEIAACRALGGTSWAWGGRCVPFDDIDFERRPWVRNSDWPLSHDDLRPWYRQACDYLLCGNDTFEIEPSLLPAQRRKCLSDPSRGGPKSLASPSVTRKASSFRRASSSPAAARRR